MNKTYATKKTDIIRNWHLIDLDGQILGRVASQISQLLIGKYKSYYAPNLDCGDHIVAINAEKIKVTGRKAKQKTYYHHSGYPSGLKAVTYEEQMVKDPRKIILSAVKNMLPKNKLRSDRLRRLRVFVGSEHDYQDKFKKDNGKNN